MSEDLNVYPIKPPKNPGKVVEFNKVLPDINNGAVVLDIRSPRQGKTTTICNLLQRESMYKDKFDTIYIFSGTMTNGDPSARFLLNDEKVNSYSSYSDETLQSILDYQSEFPIDKRPRIALIFDDFLHFDSLKATSLLFTISSAYRHYGIKLLYYSSQVYKKCPVIVRQCCNYLIMGANANQREIQKIYDEIGCRYGSQDVFYRILNKATEKPYNFLYLDLYHHPPLAYRNFNTIIYKAPNTFQVKTEKPVPEINEVEEEL